MLIVGDATSDVLVRVDAVTGEQTVLLENVPSARSIWVFKGNDVSEPPRLSVRFMGTMATISWTDPDDVWQLQVSNDVLKAASWSDSSFQPLANGPVREVSVEAVEAKQFFRLRKE